MSSLEVVVIGGGIGGLCLAQGLKKAGVSVAVYERDGAPASRLQGFRIHMSPEGSTALHACLPEELWTVFQSTGGAFTRGFTMVTEQLKELFHATSDDDGSTHQPIARHRSVSRITLRHILLSRLDGAVHFNKRFVRYEETAAGRFIAHFEDGSTAESDVLVAADGVNSPVRQQYLPHAAPVDTGVLTIGGRVPLTDGVMALLPPRLLDGPVMVMTPEPCSLFMAVWKRESGGKEYLRLLGLEDGIPEDSDYLIFGYGARREYLGLPRDPVAMTGAELKDVLRHKVVGWHPVLRKLAELIDENSIGTARIRSSEPLDAWKTTGVTLLGDAIHSMTPYRGIGANIALQDAALLCAKLTEAHRGQKPVLEAIAEYEAAMRVYGFAAVASSLKAMNQATGEKGRAFGLTKTAMRVMNTVPALRRRVMTA